MDADGIPYRTVTGTAHPLAAYFTRGTGHDEAGFYSENPEVYKNNMMRLARKFKTAERLVPGPVVTLAVDDNSAKPRSTAVGLLYFGSTEDAAVEAVDMLKARGHNCDRMRLRALPFHDEVRQFLREHEVVYVIEQNRDAQLMTLLRAELGDLARGCRSVLHFDGMPIDAEEIFTQVMGWENRA
jgi:2-oxoglutarate ferredoxin oxidoreductase subunit alpha